MYSIFLIVLQGEFAYSDEFLYLEAGPRDVVKATGGCKCPKK